MGRVNTDCFGYLAIKEDCAVLKKLYCRNEKCRFYKTKKQYELEQKTNKSLYEV